MADFSDSGKGPVFGKLVKQLSLFFLRYEIAVQINIIFIDTSNPRHAIRIERVYQHYGPV